MHINYIHRITPALAHGANAGSSRCFWYKMQRGTTRFVWNMHPQSHKIFFLNSLSSSVFLCYNHFLYVLRVRCVCRAPYRRRREKINKCLFDQINRHTTTPGTTLRAEGNKLIQRVHFIRSTLCILMVRCENHVWTLFVKGVNLNSHLVMVYVYHFWALNWF